MTIKELITGVINQQELLNYYNASIIYEELPNNIRGFVFNHDGIERIYALGYQDDSQIEFAEELMEQFRSIKGETDFS